MFRNPMIYAVKHKNNDVRENSRSGGIFTALSDMVIENGGVVYGCVLSDTLREAYHTRAESKEQRNRMRGSKYIQSHMCGCYGDVKADLLSGKQVLFSGTSCQIAGLKSFLQKNYENLICIDIVCHGVPSEKVWNQFLAWQEQRTNGRCISVDFRNKKDHGWKAHKETLVIKKSKTEKTVIIHSEVFKNLFYGHAILRPSCYKCPYKSVNHPGDLTIADYWGIEKAAPGFSDNKGVSLVLINTESGQKLFERCTDQIDYRLCKIEDSMQPPLIAPFDAPSFRDDFWQDFESNKFSKIAKKYGDFGTGNVTKHYIERVLRKIKKYVCGKEEHF